MVPKTRNTCRRVRVTKGPAHKRSRLWQAMRILRAFTVRDLQAVAEIQSYRSVWQYVRQLQRAGYIVKQAGSRGHHEEFTLRLVRDSGPICPSVCYRGTVVYDHNTDKEYPL